MKKKDNLHYLLLVFIVLLGLLTTATAQTGTIEGRIVDAVSKEPLEGASVIIEKTQLGAVSDSVGYYRIKDIPQGIYSIRISFIGYQTATKNQIFVERGVTQVNIEMEEQASVSDSVVITASAFQKSSQNLVSIRSVGVEQIRSNPGGNFDISRVVQSLPGVSGSVGFRNDIIVRGGAPNENVFYLDGVEIPNINHFATQGSGGGPVGIINSLFIEKVNFQSSAFSAKYDNTLSSVLDFDMVSGNTQRFQTTLLVSGTEAGITFDTPIGKKVTFLGSARRSYLQFLFKQIGLPFLPDYWDFQGKVQWKINPKTSLTYVGIGAIDRFTLNKATDVDSAQRYLLDGLPIFSQNSYTQGVVLKRLTPRGFYSIALSRNWLDNGSNKTDSLGRTTLRFNSVEAENKLRINFVNKIAGWELAYGGVLQYATISNETYQVLKSFNEPGRLDTLQVNNSAGLFRYGAYVSLSRNYLKNRLRTNVGLRTDMNSFTNDGNNPLEAISPRASLAYRLTERWNVSASVGIYYKLPPYLLLAYQDANGRNNKDTRYIQSTHFVAGTEYQLSPSWIISVEGFYKIYDRYPINVDNGVNLANLGSDFGVYGNSKVRSTGKGKTYGFEVFTQKMLTKHLYGTASYTFYRSEFAGADESKFIRSAWDNRHLISLTGGYIFGKKQQWEFSAKWRFLGGAPYTPFDIEASRVYYRVAGTGVFDFNQLNTLQTGVFNQLDVRFERRWLFSKWSLNLFIDIQNALNAQNPGTPNFVLLRQPGNNEFRNPPNDYTITGLSSGNLIPSIGIRVKI